METHELDHEVAMKFAGNSQNLAVLFPAGQGPNSFARAMKTGAEDVIAAIASKMKGELDQQDSKEGALQSAAAEVVSAPKREAAMALAEKGRMALKAAADAKQKRRRLSFKEGDVVVAPQK